MKQFSFSSFNFVFNEAIPLILVQIVCACFAGVYNEYLLKARNVDFWVQGRIRIFLPFGAHEQIMNNSLSPS